MDRDGAVSGAAARPYTYGRPSGQEPAGVVRQQSVAAFGFQHPIAAILKKHLTSVIGDGFPDAEWSSNGKQQEADEQNGSHLRFG
jgi:hypothetical protein